MQTTQITYHSRVLITRRPARPRRWRASPLLASSRPLARSSIPACSTSRPLKVTQSWTALKPTSSFLPPRQS